MKLNRLLNKTAKPNCCSKLQTGCKTPPKVWKKLPKSKTKTFRDFVRLLKNTEIKKKMSCPMKRTLKKPATTQTAKTTSSLKPTMKT